MKVKTVRLFLGTCAMFLLSSRVAAEEVKQITILDEQFRVVAKLVSRTDVDPFVNAWSKRIEVPPNTKRNWKFKIDLEPGDRWLYDPTGFTRVLSKAAVPDYKIGDPAAFNSLLGIHDK